MIKNSKKSTKKAIQSIKQGQDGLYKPLKTRFKHLNEKCHGGITKQKIYTIGALSGFGKSHVVRQIEEDILNEGLNPRAEGEVVLIRCDFEMTKEEYILQKVYEKTKVNFEILMYDKPSKKVKKAFKEVYLELNSENIFETFDTYSPDIFYDEIREFVDNHKHKKQIVLTIDNINLIDVEGGEESKAIAKLIAHIVKLKRECKNLSIIILAQLNRELKNRINPKEHFPRTSDFYYSSKIEFASDVQIIIHNPYMLGHIEYATVNTEKYSYLSDYMKKKTNYSTFNSKGLIFWHYLKVRLKNGLKGFKDLHIERVYEVDENDTEYKKVNATNMPNLKDEEEEIEETFK